MDNLLARCVAILQADGTAAWLVGGTVRDQLLGRDSHDIDIAVASGALATARKLANVLSGAYFPLDVERETGRIVMPDRAVIDAGSKSLSSDRIDPSAGSGYGLIRGYEDAVLERLNEEHGVIDVSRCSRKPQVGERVQILPNHVCVVSNLHDEIAVSRGGVLLDTRRVEARGKTR